MPSKQRDAIKSDVSPVLFMSVDGEPMTFFLRPGPVKRKVGPLINAGGGMLCNVQQPGAILLIDPEERGSITETTAHWYVSTQYIHDCIERDEQLNLEDYRLNPLVVQRHSARLSNKESSPGLTGGRVPYTPEDDAAILDYVSKHETETGGNKLWQEMARQRVTAHSWQSMKYRYRVRLAKKESEVVEVATTEEKPKAAEEEIKAEGKETDGEKPSGAGDTAAPQTHSTESDQTQIVDQPIPAETKQPELVETRETVETETPNSPQPEGACLDPPTDAHPIPAESTEPETDEPQTSVSPQKESVPEDSESQDSDTSSQKKPKGKQQASPRLEQPQRRSTRRQLQLEELFSPDAYGKKLRSSSSSAEQPSSSPQPLKKTKPAPKSALQNDTTVDEPLSKKAREEKEAAVVESGQEETGQATVSETAQADTESKSMPQREEKKKEKRKLGILELATKEFEDESESDEDEGSDPLNPTETATGQPTSTEPPLPAPDAAASTGSNPEPGPNLRENGQETQAPSSNGPLPAEPATSEPAAVNASSKAHLFIFESETQEEDSQSIIGGSRGAPAEPQPAVNKDGAYSLTQVQLEEDTQRIRELMKETNQDLVSVTKALLRTSGDFAAAVDLLLNPFSTSRPFWKCSDDPLLLSGDPEVRQQLVEKYGEKEVAKRIMFLELEG